MIYSYGDIQRSYDEALKKNREFSVFVLPEKIPYFNTFLPTTSYYSKNLVLQYLINSCYVYDNTQSTLTIHKRLLLTREAFPSVDWKSFLFLVDKALLLYHDDEDRFVPNANALSIRNPYFRFGSNVTKPEMRKVRRQHRAELKELYLKPEIDHRIYEFLQDYDLGGGLLSKEKIKAELQISRRVLDRCLTRNLTVTDMYEAIRKASRSKAYHKKIEYESRNDIPNGKHTAETIKP